MKKCELCNSPARMYCDSDQASLCWKCDSTVHSANFLVARHSRSLLCHVCQSRTPWTASGAEFGPTVSVCRRCVADGAEKTGIRDASAESERRRNETEIESDEEEEEVGDSDDGDVDLQVVPWSSSTPSPPPATSSSCGGDEYSTDGESPISSLKRSREISSDLRLQEDAEPWNKRRKDIGSRSHR